MRLNTLKTSNKNYYYHQIIQIVVQIITQIITQIIIQIVVLQNWVNQIVIQHWKVLLVGLLIHRESTKSMSRSNMIKANYKINYNNSQ